jgi:hypothetical protein
MAVDYSTAVDALVEAARSVGLSASVPSAADDTGVDLVIDVGGRLLPVQLKTASTVTPGSVPREPAHPASIQAMRLLVADRIVAAARDALNQAGWGWLDLRGHLHLTGPGVLVDTAVPPLDRTTTRQVTNPFGGTVALEVASSLLINPDQPPSVRRLAADLGRAPSSVSAALRGLRAADLLNANQTPAVPELFWELVAAWHPASALVARFEPEIDDAAIAGPLGTNFADPHGTIGWALTDTRAAVAYGAPVGTRADYPPDFYVPDQATAHRAQLLLGVPVASSVRAATVRIAPVSQVCGRRVARRSGARWPLAHPLFVALDLAGDQGRGREILDGWRPEGGFARVW